MTRILYIEDNEIIAEGIKSYLEHENFFVDICPLIREGIKMLDSNFYDLILLDIMLPDGNGIDLYKNVKSKFDIPVIFLTAKDSEDDIVKCIDLGADDYIIKSFRMRELIARIKNVLRRKETSSIIQVENIIFNEKNNNILKNGIKIELTALEYKIFSILIENINNIVTREYLLSRIWDEASNFVNDNTLTVYIKRLREKIEDDPNTPKIIKTIRGIGYKIENNEKYK